MPSKKRKLDDDIDINNATDLMNYLQPTYDFTDDPAPGEDLVARMDAIKVQETLVNKIKDMVSSGEPITWGSYKNPVTGQVTGFTNRVAMTYIDDALNRLDSLYKNTESMNLSQLSLAATTVAPGEGERRGDGNCYIQTINIGQGDCTAIATPLGRLILVDMGSDSMTDIKLDWPSSGPPTKNTQLNKIVLPILLNDLRRNIFLGTTKFIQMVILSHTDGDHHNRLFNLGIDMQFARVYYSGAEVASYHPTSNYLNSQTARGGFKKVDLKPETGTATITKKLNNNIPPTRSVSQKPDYFDYEYIDSVTGAIVLYEETNGFKISVLASNVEGVMFPTGPKGVWTTDDAVIKNLPGEEKLKLNATDANKKSLVVMVEFGGNKAVITGDATAVTEYFMATQATYTSKLNGLTMYRIPHHASLTSSAKVMVNKLTNLNWLIGSCSGKWTVVHRLPKKEIFQLYSPKKPATARQIWCFDIAPSGNKAMVPFNNITFGTGSNGTQILKFLKA